MTDGDNENKDIMGKANDFHKMIEELLDRDDAQDLKTDTFPYVKKCRELLNEQKEYNETLCKQANSESFFERMGALQMKVMNDYMMETTKNLLKFFESLL